MSVQEYEALVSIVMSEMEVHRRISYIYTGPFPILCTSLEFQDHSKQSVRIAV